MGVMNKIARGGLVGLVNGFFGGGGGMIAVPLLKEEMEEKNAHATAILVILPVCMFALIAYAVRGDLSPSVFLPVSLGSSFGALVGTWLLCKLNVKIVDLLFAFLMLVSGVWLYL